MIGPRVVALLTAAVAALAGRCAGAQRRRRIIPIAP